MQKFLALLETTSQLLNEVLVVPAILDLGAINSPRYGRSVYVRHASARLTGTLRCEEFSKFPLSLWQRCRAVVRQSQGGYNQKNIILNFYSGILIYGGMGKMIW